MERMSALDATFLAIEDRSNHMHIGAIAVFDGTPPPHDEMLAFVGTKLPFIKRYRQKLVVTPFGLARPRWADDSRFRIENHVYRVGVPAPGGPDELRELIGYLMAQPLDRARPLWELCVVEGLRGGGWALVTKVHHCMVDGIAGSDLLAVLLDTERSPEPVPLEEDWRPAPAPSIVERAASSLRAAVDVPARAARATASAARSPRRFAREIADTTRFALRLTHPAPRSSLTGPIGPLRRWTTTDVDLDDVKAVRVAFGGTVNDVALTLVTAGLRDLLLTRGEAVDDRTVRTLVPVSVRAPDARGVLDNRVAALVADLPAGVRDPVARLDAVKHEMDGRKRSGETAGTGLVLGASDALLPPAAALVARLVAHHQHSVETVTTNVPGPELPLYLRGREMVAVHPYVPLAGTVRVGIAMLSYRGTLSIGVTGDGDAARDIDVVTAGIERALRELLDAAAATMA